MNNEQRYLIAKYVPDLHRMEPVNIGVVIWARGLTASAFLRNDEASPYVNEVATYARWLSYWEGILDSGKIKTRQGEYVDHKNPAFVDELIKTQKGNFLLSDGGIVVEKLTSRNINDAAKFLYSELVAKVGKHKPTSTEQAIQLRFLSRAVMKASGVYEHEEFQQSYPVNCRVGDAHVGLKVHYAIGNGKPRTIFQRVHIGASQSVCGASFIFEHVAESEHLSKEQCAALIYADEEQITGKNKNSAVALLSQLATVINLKNQASAAERIAELAAAAGSHS